MLMTLSGREVPDYEPELMFTVEELAYLTNYARRHRLAAPKRLGDVVKAVADLGGYQSRKGDPEPGHQILWRRQTRLTAASYGHQIGLEDGYAQRFRDGQQAAAEP